VPHRALHNSVGCDATQSSTENVPQVVDREMAETPKQKQDDDREAERMVRQGYALVARVDAVHSEEAETIDVLPSKAQFTYADGRCLELLYVGRDYSSIDGNKEMDLRLNTPEDEARARQQMKFRIEMHRLAQEMDKKENH
jgi:hypothetical protein